MRTHAWAESSDSLEESERSCEAGDEDYEGDGERYSNRKTPMRARFSLPRVPRFFRMLGSLSSEDVPRCSEPKVSVLAPARRRRRCTFSRHRTTAKLATTYRAPTLEFACHGYSVANLSICQGHQAVPLAPPLASTAQTRPSAFDPRI